MSGRKGRCGEEEGQKKKGERRRGNLRTSTQHKNSSPRVFSSVGANPFLFGRNEERKRKGKEKRRERKIKKRGGGERKEKRNLNSFHLLGRFLQFTLQPLQIEAFEIVIPENKTKKKMFKKKKGEWGFWKKRKEGEEEKDDD